MSYTDLINVNIAPLNATKIGVYNASGNRVGKIELGNLKKSNLGNKLYSFGAISDIHLQDQTAQTDFQTALTYLNNNESVAFTCICGDLTTLGTNENLLDYKTYVETYSPNTPVYAMSGNHDGKNANGIENVIENYTGHPLYYSFTQGNDVFIFVGVKADKVGQLFTTAELQWLYDTLEANRNKRCFVFEHVRPDDSCGNAYGIYAYDIWGGTEQTVFESLMSHYKNVILFHGHSHLRFGLQTKDNKANYEHDLFGIHSIHIPSLAVPRTGDASGASSRTELYAESEGYVVDVYENAIVLRGRDFVDAKFLPIATYYLDTTLQNVAKGTYTDSTGTIDTTLSYTITNNLTNVTSSNNITNIDRGQNYSATITPSEGYNINVFTVTMGGTDITTSAVSGNTISISKVTGNIVITCTAISNTKPCTNISLNNTTLTLTTEGQSETLVATVTPSDTTDNVAWSVSPTGIVTVDNGVVTPIADSGDCVVTVTCGEKTATCNVSVNIPKPSNALAWTRCKLNTSTGSDAESTESATANIYFSSNFIRYKHNQYAYSVSLPITKSDMPQTGTIKYQLKVFYYDINKNFISASSTDLISTNTEPITNLAIPVISNAGYIRFRGFVSRADEEQMFKDNLTLNID